MSTLFDIAYPTIPIAGRSETFPVHRIYCIGRNYAAHVREMGNDPKRDAPVWFMKPADSIVPGGGRVPYPPGTEDLHHEIELVVALFAGGRQLTVAEARAAIFGYAVGIDMTRRDLQLQFKKHGQPWDPAKSFEFAAPVSAIQPVAEIGHPESGRIWLSVNGDMRQDGNISDLIWKVPDALAELSNLFTLAPGDLLFTGTPAGVGPVVPGDKLSGGVEAV
ncbi:MAG: fumarylacetoacetate hydrolase family protein, partial [Woeseia sp.]|nr:fumarylacetoacetate hydrolase family protein [Woeseia sp.]